MKTAEEILIDVVFEPIKERHRDVEGWKRRESDVYPLYIKAMRDFAAQEVAREIEEYKSKVIETILSSNIECKSKVVHLIDTVK